MRNFCIKDQSECLDLRPKRPLYLTWATRMPQKGLAMKLAINTLDARPTNLVAINKLKGFIFPGNNYLRLAF